ncbi:hypothetical protein Salat_0182800 [Sesamum alatum]|uniref:Uncharacterized protein n=1 Tax=Sesamum alatum TaxID=300844 RepID=A0AAE2CXY2_9LAMI|nr:hypothetical protein Salat_0182800 [Sesamum alatum]
MEATFVGALVEHKKHGNFKRKGINFHVVISAIYDVNKEHSSRHLYTTGENKLRKLKERYLVFSSIITVLGVIVNKERVLAKCYVNAYEDFYEGLCMLYGPHNADDKPTVFHVEEEMDSVASFYPPIGWVDDSPREFYPNVMLANIYKLDTTSVDSTSLWRFLEEYYASDDEDGVNSILALPAAPPPSPDLSYVSVEYTSSSASNEISKSILHNPTFEWDRENNIVHAPFAAWVALIRQNPFADAYLKRGEPKWDSLKLIFERNQVGGRAYDNEIVTISSRESDDDSYDDDEDDEDTVAEEIQPDPESVIDLATSESD